jgi:hypothetical protein
MDGLTLLLVGVAALGLWRGGSAPAPEASPARDALPLLAPGDPPGALYAPGAAPAQLRAKLSAVGEVITVEDLARGVLALQEGQLPGVEPLPEALREELSRRLTVTNQRREELLALETQLATEEARLAAEARSLAEGLTPEQRAWVAQQRDVASVGAVERAYWEALLQTLSAPASGAAP